MEQAGGGRGRQWRARPRRRGPRRPRSTRHPFPARRLFTAGEPEADALLGRAPRPGGRPGGRCRPVGRGTSGPPAGRAPRRASRRLRARRAAVSSCGATASAARSAVLPAWMPPTSGSTRRSATWRPSRRAIRSATREVGRPGGRGQDQVQAGAEHPGGREQPRAQDGPTGRARRAPALGQGPEAAAHPQHGPPRLRGDQLGVDAELPAQVHAVGDAGDEGVGALVDEVAGEAGWSRCCRRAGPARRR